MRRFILTVMALALAVPAAFAQEAAKSSAPAEGQKAAAGQQKEFWVFKDKGAKDNHFAASGWMGDVGDIKLNEAST